VGILVTPIAALALFNENVKHYVSIEYETAQQKKAGLLIQADKDNYRNVLALLRGATGKEIETEKKNQKPKKPLNEKQTTMKQALVLLILLALTALTNIAQKPGHAVPIKAVERSRKAANVLELAMAKSDARIPKVLLSSAVAVAVVTEMKTIGLLIDSGGDGYGVVTRRFPTGKWEPACIHSHGRFQHRTSPTACSLVQRDPAFHERQVG
jgi:hypothetical protein